MTNKGLQIETRFLEFRQQGRFKVIPLNCSSFEDGSDHSKQPVPFALVVMVSDPTRNVFFRIRPQKDVISSEKWRNIWSAHEAVSGSNLETKVDSDRSTYCYKFMLSCAGDEGVFA